MKISIITPSFNQGRFIEDTIRSVQCQSECDSEHWVIDGGSTDNTVEILKNNPHLNWVSEEDNGQSDALRKGFERSRGEIIGWINSDDYYEQGALQAVTRAFENPDVHWVVGDLAYLYDGAGQIVANRSPTITHAALCENPDIVRQQGTFFRRKLLVEAGGWEPRFHMTMDYDLWTRLARIAAPIMLPQRLAYFRIHEAQKTSARNIQTQADELAEIMHREGASERAIRNMRAVKKRLILKLQLKAFLVKTGIIGQRFLSQPMRPN